MRLGHACAAHDDDLHIQRGQPASTQPHDAPCQRDNVSQESFSYDPAGGELDQSGRRLYHFGERFYAPGIGRWTQQDPIDQPADLRQANRYIYAAADPINFSDPHGEIVPLIAGAVARYVAPRIAAQVIKYGSRYGAAPGLRKRIYADKVLDPAKDVPRKAAESVARNVDKYADKIF